MSESDVICYICGMKFHRGDTKELSNGKWVHFGHGLPEKLKAMIVDVENARGPAKHVLNDYLANLGQVVWDHGDEIIAALEARQNKKESHVVNHLS